MKSLIALRRRGYQFRAITLGGEIAAVVGWYGWPSFNDQIHLWGEDDALAVRENVRREVVWSWRGGADEVACALLDLPAPHTLWLPRS